MLGVTDLRNKPAERDEQISTDSQGLPVANATVSVDTGQCVSVGTLPSRLRGSARLLPTFLP
jgi:hypothetical protein